MSKNRIVFIVGLLLVFITIFNGPPLWFKWAIVFLSGLVLILVSLRVSVGRRSIATKENPPTREKPAVVENTTPKPEIISEEVLETKQD